MITNTFNKLRAYQLTYDRARDFAGYGRYAAEALAKKARDMIRPGDDPNEIARIVVPETSAIVTTLCDQLTAEQRKQRWDRLRQRLGVVTPRHSPPGALAPIHNR